jgi:hypothetical protein
VVTDCPRADAAGPADDRGVPVAVLVAAVIGDDLPEWIDRQEGITELAGPVHHFDAGGQGEFNRSSQHQLCG